MGWRARLVGKSVMSERPRIDTVQELLLARQDLVEQWNALATQMRNVMKAIVLVEEKTNQLVNENAKLQKASGGLGKLVPREQDAT